MKFNGVLVKTVTQDVVKGEIKITFTVGESALSLDAARRLSAFAGREAADLDVVFRPHQLPLFDESYSYQDEHTEKPDFVEGEVLLIEAGEEVDDYPNCEGFDHEETLEV
jgi:hypothetical protein